jgi:hypothetical protein
MRKISRIMIAVAVPCWLGTWPASIRSSYLPIVSSHGVHDSSSSVLAFGPEKTIQRRPPSSEIVTDGATRPDLIPEDLAARHFLAALATPGRPSTADIKRIDVVASVIGLSATDRLAFQEAVRGLTDNIAAAERTAGPGTARSRRTEVLESVRAQLHDRLSSTGYDHFERFVQSRVKSRIRIYRWPAMTANHSRAAVH